MAKRQDLRDIQGGVRDKIRPQPADSFASADMRITRLTDHPGAMAISLNQVTPAPAVPGMSASFGPAPGMDRGRPPIGRIPVLDVKPLVDGGRFPVKAVTGEQIPVSAVVFREGHDAVAATAVLIDPDGQLHTQVRLTPASDGSDLFTGQLRPDRVGQWTYRVEGWSDPYGTWDHDATIKIAAGVDVEVMLEEGARLFERVLATTNPRKKPARTFAVAIEILRDRSLTAEQRLAAGLTPQVRTALASNPLRDFVSPSEDYRLEVQRERALVSSWYELFPRSEGAHVDDAGRWVSGTFAQAQARLPKIREMGFDIVYLPPIHPVGRINRKGPNNTLTPGPDDPGSTWAIGSAEGGHDTVHPDLGTLDDFDDFVGAATAQGLEVALDFALQCAPDHPWASAHPEWFTTRADGTIAYAENPPKKYQDIYPINFDIDPAGIAAEVLRVLRLWISHGVTVFRVDNPHTKAVAFWEYVIATINAERPDILFLAEAFTRPAMMQTLAKVGFHQSYTYFTWRTAKWELEQYITELSGSSADYMRPNFWPNTPDILHEFLQYGGPAAFKLRAVLAATLSPSWGIYSGYELCEHVAVRGGSEEYLDSEKYQYRPRDWSSYEEGGTNHGRSIAPYITRLNQARREHRALQRLRNTVFHTADDEQVICYSRRLESDSTTGEPEDVLIVVVNLDPHGTRETFVHLNMPQLGLDWFDGFTVEDLLTGESFQWQEHNFVRLDPFHQPAHVLHVRRL
jgi:starch synthase (maltosyl-transferring)